MVKTYFNENYRKTVKDETITLTGSCFIADNLFKNELFLNELKKIQNVDKIEDILNQFNGFYAFVISLNNGERCVAAVDKVRSIPLFYGKNENTWYISNDVEWLRQQICDMDIDPIAEHEFLKTGYVTGQGTLFKEIKQIQAGEFICIDGKNDELVTKRYYKYLPKEPKPPSNRESYLKALDDEVTKIVQRLILYAEGRQIVIPLSAGRDSRLIAFKLKQLGYQNVLCFSYGIKGNFESETSRVVAGLLGFRWEYVEYTKELWRKWYESPERKEFYTMALNYSSLPNMQDWQAVWDLKRSALINEDAVFVPGHSGDFLAGSHIPLQIYPNKKATICNLTNLIKEKHYSLIYRNESFQEKLLWKNRIHSACENTDIEIAHDLINTAELWNWQERQAKFIVNCARVYEFWGYDWWFPLWDSEYMGYWQNVPLKYRKNKQIYDEYVDALLPELGFKAENGIRSKLNYLKSTIRATLKKMLPEKPFLKMIRKRSIERYLISINDVLGVLGAFSEEFISKNKKYLATINGLFAIYTIEELRKTLK